MAGNNLSSIRTKIRRLIRSPKASQISDVQINDYINTYLLYDFPARSSLLTMLKTFSFYTTPNVDTYYTNTNNINDPMYNFKNVIISSYSPIYIGGYRCRLTQSRSNFFSWWQTALTKTNIGTGDDITTNFTGTLATIPVTPREVLFSSEATNGVGQALIDVPLVSTALGQGGVELFRGNLYDPRGDVPTKPTVTLGTNTINYFTGVYNITFSDAPASGKTISVQTLPYQASRPQDLLFFNNTFTVRPIPDDTYEVKIEAEIRPTELTDDADVPELEQWWQLIAVCAAKKIFEDRTDFEGARALIPLCEEQNDLADLKTIKQLEQVQVPTIYDGHRGSGMRVRPWSRTYF